MAAQNVGAGSWDRIGRIAASGVGFNLVLTGALVAVLSLFLGNACMLPPSVAQNRPPAPPIGQQNAPEDEGTIRMKKDMAKKANSERHEALKRDTDHLLELAQQLKNQVDKSSENTLSLDVMKKAEEIEKLAHSVKDKMKGY